MSNTNNKIWPLPQKIARLFFCLLLKLCYRTKVRGLENLPREGGAVLAFNHCSWLDGVTILSLQPFKARTIAWSGNFTNPIMKWWAGFSGVILISGGPKSIRRGLEEAKKALESGHYVAIFPEGGISQTGQIRSTKPGLMKILEGLDDVPVVPCHIDEMWGSIFSYKNGKVLNHLPTSMRRPLSMHIGQPIYPKSKFDIFQAMQRLSTESVDHRVGRFVSAPEQLIKKCKQAKFRIKICDSTGQSEKGGTLITKALVLRRLLKKHVLGSDEKNVGVLIPPSNGGAIVNFALALDRRVAVNLNYSLSQELINQCIKLAGITHVLTSRKVMEKFDFELEAEVVYLEDFKEKVTVVDKVISAFQSYAVPASLLSSMLGLKKIKADDLLTIIFTSGSTGVPKGVMLSHQNIVSNMRAVDQAAGFAPTDTMIGILPFFHSFGYTATLWAGAACDMRVAYHFSPLDAKQVGKLARRYEGTILVATPTFLRSYMKRCSEDDFKHLDIVVAGAERLPPELCDAFEKKFGVIPVEGYGATELSPITAVNIPPSRQYDKFQVDDKIGTVGRPVWNVSAKVTDLDTGQELSCGEPGMLWIKGPNVMLGYLGREDLTQEVVVDGWYKTGDVAEIDEDGFIKITGRMSRFSKIGGEMVPHIKIEEILTRLCDETPEDDTDNDQPNVAVTAVPDAKKGERLIVLHTKIPRSTDELINGLKEEGLPNIFVPSADSFKQVESLPQLGSGKLDLKGLKQMALDLFTE
jgi:acyl-[acyl-carrier-protein]-phospholipid O-acyltransferase/long-chain-fatty-acid--[acyl-carrier-protein] ligase